MATTTLFVTSFILTTSFVAMIMIVVVMLPSIKQKREVAFKDAD